MNYHPPIPTIADATPEEREQYGLPLPPDIDHLITEDDTPVDNLLSEKQQRLLVGCLYSSWSPGIPFFAAANVGLFYGLKLPAIVPDVMLSLGVEVAEDWSKKQNRSYFIWEFGKPPEVAIEIVSNPDGNELGRKFQTYARAAVAYYVVFDPLHKLGEPTLRLYQLQGNQYIDLSDYWLDPVGLGLTLWQGQFEGKTYEWLRWCDREGNLILTGDERAEQERQRAERLAELLKAQGIDPDGL